MQCIAKAKQTGEQCKRSAVVGRSVCNIHGGKSPRGIASPQTRQGRYSQDLPTRLQGRYEEAQHDTELLALRDEIALLDARLSDVLSRVDTGESGSIWTNLKAAAADLLYARKIGNQADMTVALNTMLDLVRSGHQDYAAWQDVRSLLEQRRRTVESERKRLVEMQQSITVEKAMLLVGAIGGIIKAHVHDRDALAAITRDLGSLLDRPTDHRLDSGEGE